MGSRTKIINKFMKVTLNISERIFALGILNGFKGKMETMVTILKDIQGVSLTPEDRTKCEWKEQKNSEGVLQSVTWNDEKDSGKELEFQSPTLDYILETIEDRNKKGDFSFQDKAVISLKEKLTK